MFMFTWLLSRIRDDTLIGLIHVTPKTHPWFIKGLNPSSLCLASHFAPTHFDIQLSEYQNGLGHTSIVLELRILDYVPWIVKIRPRVKK